MSDDAPQPREAAIAALDRAHLAARDAIGAELRRALEEARDALQGTTTAGANRLTKALADFDSGSLAELELLLESVRRELGSA